MEITIKINGRMVSVEVNDEVAECYDQGRRKAENLYHEKRRHWDDREFDEYTAAAEGLMPCQYTPEELACQQETLDEIFSVLDTCTPTQRERFLLFALDGYTYTEISRMCNCSKVAVHQSIKAVREKFLKFFSQEH